MESIKSKERFFEPGPRSQSLGPPLEDQYELLDYFRLPNGVPGPVRGSMNSVVTLRRYGWLYYPFYPLPIFLSASAIEMALQERFPEERRRGLESRSKPQRALAHYMTKNSPVSCAAVRMRQCWTNNSKQALPKRQSFQQKRLTWTCSLKLCQKSETGSHSLRCTP